MASEVNLVFQGGGVKGIALVGFLSGLEKASKQGADVIVRGVGGASAGAITASLYAAGYSAGELYDELLQSPIGNLVSKHGTVRSVFNVLSKNGVYDTRRIYSWIKELLRKKDVTTFRDYQRPGKMHCRIIAANLTNRAPEMFREGDSHEVAAAVLKSVSIPLFFMPYIDGQSVSVDGGMLSNYPLWLFRDSQVPTVGVRMVNAKNVNALGIGPTAGLGQYIAALLATMMEAHDRYGRGDPPIVRHVEIDIGEVQTTAFDLDETEQIWLFNQGQTAAWNFSWSSLPARYEARYNDPQAGQVLRAAMHALDTLFSRSRASNKREYEFIDSTYVIGPNGDGEIIHYSKFQNCGPGTISMMGKTFDYGEPVDVSLADIDLAINCTPGEILLLPRANDAGVKKFVFAFAPAIGPSELREISLRAKLPGYFTKLCRDKEDEIDIQEVAENGVRRFSLTIEADPSVGKLDIVQPDIALNPGVRRTPTSRGYRYELGPTSGDVVFRTRIRLT